jgi:hypothetical protein
MLDLDEKYHGAIGLFTWLWSAPATLGPLKVYGGRVHCVFFCEETLNLLLPTRSFSLDLIPDREITGVNVSLWQPELAVYASLLVDSLTFVGDVSSSATTESPRLKTRNSVEVEKYHRMSMRKTHDSYWQDGENFGFKQLSNERWLSSGMLRPDDWGSRHLWNVVKLLPDYTAQHPRRQSSSFSPPWNPINSSNCTRRFTFV